jgi:type I site-specific restriction-modification system R (restriction) subunit
MNFKKSFGEFQKDISNTFKDLKWNKPKIKNGCTAGPGSKIQLSNTQKFVSMYFTPSNPNGILLWHSVGSGKTLSAVSILSQFEKQGYNTLWVTRTTLRKDLQKALDMVPLKHHLLAISYKQFSNICKKSGENYHKLIRRAKKLNSATNDPFYKTVIIVDEAHKLYTKDLKAQEMHDINAIQKKIFESYGTSANASCKVVLMTGTPITENSIEIIKLLNLLIQTPSKRFNEDTFYKSYLDAEGKFTENGKERFKENIKGLVSYIDLSNDPSKFAIIDYREILVPLSKNPEDTLEEALAAEKCKAEYKACRDINISAQKCLEVKRNCLKYIKAAKEFAKKNKSQQFMLKDRCDIQV